MTAVSHRPHNLLICDWLGSRQLPEAASLCLGVLLQYLAVTHPPHCDQLFTRCFGCTCCLAGQRRAVPASLPLLRPSCFLLGPTAALSNLLQVLLSSTNFPAPVSNTDGADVKLPAADELAAVSAGALLLRRPGSLHRKWALLSPWLQSTGLLPCVQVLSGSADLQALEDPSIQQPELHKALLRLPGMGPYTSANVLQLLGHYSCVPCDSETLRHLQDVHGLRTSSMATVQADAQKVIQPAQNDAQQPSEAFASTTAAPCA